MSSVTMSHGEAIGIIASASASDEHFRAALAAELVHQHDCIEAGKALQQKALDAQILHETRLARIEGLIERGVCYLFVTLVGVVGLLLWEGVKGLHG